MKSSYRMLIVTLAFCLTNILASYGQAHPNQPTTKMDSQHPQPIQIDTEKTAIIPFAPDMRYPFDNTHKPAVINQSDIYTTETLLAACVAHYNKSLNTSSDYRKINLDKHTYRKQLIAVINAKGEKEVWVNCFCRTLGDNWKKEILLVKGGGSCFFNVKINLTTEQYFAFSVNSQK